MILDSLRLWNHLFGRRQGLLCVTTARRTAAGLANLRDTYFQWPTDAEAAVRGALDAAQAGHEVFFVATLLQQRRRHKVIAAPIGALFVDSDVLDAKVPAHLPQPTAVVESSPGHHHWYWRLGEPLEPAEGERLNKSLATALGGDKSGWDAVQLLRVPGTTNYKYPATPPVRLRSIDDTTRYSAEDFDVAPPSCPPRKPAPVPVRQPVAESATPPVPLYGMALEVWRGSRPATSEDGMVDRSATLFKIGAALAEAGATVPVITAALVERDATLGYRKYTERTDAMHQYDEIAQRVTAQYDAGETGLPDALRQAILTEDLTDRRVAECVVTWYGDQIRYAPDRCLWLEWQGTHWAIQPDAAAARERIVATARRLQRLSRDYGQRMMRGHDLLSKALTVENNGKMRGIVETLSMMPTIQQTFSEFDADPWLFNVANGTINLKTGALQPHNPADLITKIAPVTYDADATARAWERFLQQIFCGDGDLMNYVQRLIGYSLAGIVSEKALFILYGSGHNGKSVFLETLRVVLGDYASAFDADALLQQKHTKHPASLAVLAGTRLVYAQETGEGKRLDEALVKALTGGDTIRVRRMHENPWEMKPTFTMLVSTNSKPVVAEQGIAIWDRLKPIPFRYTVPAAERIPAHELLQCFVAEGAGILRWAVAGCQQYLADGSRLIEPPIIRQEIAEYRQEMDVLGRFLDETCIAGEGFKVPVTRLYAAYTEWCDRNGQNAWPALVLRRKVEERGFKARSFWYKGRHDAVAKKDRCWAGLGLRVDVEKQLVCDNSQWPATTALTSITEGEDTPAAA